MSEKNIVFGCCCCGIITITIIILIASSFVYVPIEHWGLKVDSISKEIDPTPLKSGAYGNSLGKQVYLFPRSVETINFMESYGSDSDEKVLRLTASDAASVLLQISFSYRLKEENLAELYKEHGFNWKTSIQSNTRSLLRNEGAQFRALDYVKDSQRIVIEKAFDTAMRKYFKDGVVKGVPVIEMIGFYLLGVDFEVTNGRDKNEDILNQIKTVKDQEKIAEESKLQVITEVTNTNISKLREERTAYVAVETQKNANLKSQKEVELVGVKATTNLLVSEIKAAATANATNFRSETDNLVAIKNNAIVTYRQETIQFVNAIESSTSVLEAQHMQAMAEIRATAQKNADIIVAKAKTDAYLNQTAALEEAYKNMATDLALTGEELNTLKFIKSIEMHSDDDLFMDVQKPTALNLQGQNAKYLNSLKSD
jgi:hypothetical protein